MTALSIAPRSLENSFHGDVMRAVCVSAGRGGRQHQKEPENPNGTIQSTKSRVAPFDPKRGKGGEQQGECDVHMR